MKHVKRGESESTVKKDHIWEVKVQLQQELKKMDLQNKGQ